MGRQKGEEYMDNIEASIVQQYLQYKDLISEYSYLASRMTLTESQADRIDQILSQAQSDTLLEFFLDEADHIVAHHLNLIKPEIIEHQQDKLRNLIEKIWGKKIIDELQHTLAETRCKQLQERLKRKGLYTGSIDGVIGDTTNKALENLKLQQDIDPEDNQLIYLCNINL